MPAKRTNTRTRRAAPRRTSKVARTAKSRTTRVVRGRTAAKKTQSKSRKAKSRVIVVRGSQKKVRNPFNILQAGPNGFAVKIAGVRGVMRSAWVFGK